MSHFGAVCAIFGMKFKTIGADLPTIDGRVGIFEGQLTIISSNLCRSKAIKL